jgi:perosamine synthetase
MKVLYDTGLGDAERQAVVAVLQGSKFGDYEQKMRLEKEFCSYIGAKYAIAVSSGTAGLHCCLLALGVKSGDEVLTAPNTHSSPPMCIMNVGAKPVFVDIDYDTLNINPSKIEAKITPKTKVLLPVHSNGHPYDVDPVNEIARKHGLAVIEDAAQSLGAKYKGRRLGTFGDVSIHSFARHKHVMAGGWGGIVLTNNEEIAYAVRTYANQGRGSKYNQMSDDGAPIQQSEKSGYSYWLSEIHAAIARVQFKKFQQGSLAVEKRRKIADRYNKLLHDIHSLQRPVEKEWAYHSYCRYVVRAKDRDRLYAHLTKRQIYVGIHYYTPVYKEPYYTSQYGPSTEDFPVTEKSAREVLTLPSWATLTPRQQNYVVNCVKRFYQD